MGPLSLLKVSLVTAVTGLPGSKWQIVPWVLPASQTECIHDRKHQLVHVKRTCEDTANNEIKNYESILYLFVDRMESCDFRLGNIRVR
jgi:hypothetical protein